nr:zinc ribbon domain-containing protein [bacterium]
MAKNITRAAGKQEKAIIAAAQERLADYRRQQNVLYAQIGKLAVERDGMAGFGTAGQQLSVVQGGIRREQSAMEQAKARLEEIERQEAERRRQEAKQTRAARTGGRICTVCGNLNAKGSNFCQACGRKLEVEPPQKPRCPACGAEYTPGNRFCGACGHALEG